MDEPRIRAAALRRRGHSLRRERAEPQKTPEVASLPEPNTDRISRIGLWGTIGALAILVAITGSLIWDPGFADANSGGEISINAPISKIVRTGNSVQDRLTIYSILLTPYTWIDVPNSAFRVVPSRGSCLSPTAPRQIGEFWRITLNPSVNCRAGSVTLDATTHENNSWGFRAWVRLPWYRIVWDAASSSPSSLKMISNFSAGQAHTMATGESQTLVRSEIGSVIPTSSYRCRTTNMLGEIAANVSCTAALPPKMAESYGYIVLPGWSFNFQDPNYPTFCVAATALMGALIGALIPTALQRRRSRRPRS